MQTNKFDGSRIDNKTKSLLLKLNINDPVFVKLTDLGRTICENEHEHYKNIKPSIAEYRPRNECKDGYSQWTLGELFELFGGYVFHGSPDVFEGDILIARKIHDV
jgi:hypothetical protein